MFPSKTLSSNTRATNSTLGIYDVDEFLRSYDDRFAMEVLPAIVVMGVLAVVGVIGNCLVCYIYIWKFKRSTTRCFIVALAVYDLMNCIISIPIEIADMRFNYTFGSYGLCKVARVFVAFSSIASGTVLLAVAVDRYKKICKPLKSQTTAVLSKVAIIICSLSAFLVALPAGLIYGGKTVMTGNIHVNGSDCSTADEFVGTPIPLIYNGVQFLIFLSATFTLTVLYGLIWRQVCHQQHFRESMRAQKGSSRPTLHIFTSLKDQDQSSDSLDTSDDLLSTTSEANAAHRAGIPMSSTRRELLDTSNGSELETAFNGSDHVKHSRLTLLKKKISSSQSGKKPPKGKGLSRSSRNEKGIRKTTFMLFLITLVFVLSYLPHLGLMAARAVHKTVFDNLEGGENAAYNLFLRSYFINSASNPIIYSLCNGHFRRELKQLAFKITCRRQIGN